MAGNGADRVKVELAMTLFRISYILFCKYRYFYNSASCIFRGSTGRHTMTQFIYEKISLINCKHIIDTICTLFMMRKQLQL